MEAYTVTHITYVKNIKKIKGHTYFLPHMEKESQVSQMQCMKFSFFSPKTELISVCLWV